MHHDDPFQHYRSKTSSFPGSVPVLEHVRDRFSSGRNGYHVFLHAYSIPLFPPLLSRDDFSGGEKMRETRRCGRSVGYTRVQERGECAQPVGVSTHEGRGGLWGFAVGRSRNYTVKRGTKGRTVRTSVEKFYGAACATGWGGRACAV